MPKQRSESCSTCPWINTIFGDCFDPAVLERTIVADYLNDRAQTCHSNHELLCAGALSFGAIYGDLYANACVRMAAIAGIIDPEKIDLEADVFESIPEMLESHARRSGINNGNYNI